MTHSLSGWTFKQRTNVLPVGLFQWHRKSANVFPSAHLHWNLYLSTVTMPSCNNRNIKTDSLASWKWVWGMFALRVQYNDLAYKEWCTVQLPRDRAIKQHIKTLNGKRHKIHYVSAKMKRLTLLALSKCESVQHMHWYMKSHFAAVEFFVGCPYWELHAAKYKCSANLISEIFRRGYLSKHFVDDDDDKSLQLYIRGEGRQAAKHRGEPGVGLVQRITLHWFTAC